MYIGGDLSGQQTGDMNKREIKSLTQGPSTGPLKEKSRHSRAI